MTTGKIVHCLTTDGNEIAVEMKYIRQSKTIDLILKHMGMNDLYGERIEISILLSSNVFEKVIEWIREHEGE
jgi:hypothetical protein